jgi:hypothetical protein
MPQTFWFYVIVHATRMMNAIPGIFSSHLASPFLLVHGVDHDKGTWIPIFPLCCFDHDCYGDQQQSKHQAHTMDGIVVSRCPTSHALLVYNPRNKKHYKPISYRIYPYHLPVLVYPGFKYDSGLFCYLLQDDNPHMKEKYPPGTWVERVDKLTHTLLAGIVLDIPLPVDGDPSFLDRLYMILFDNHTTALIFFLEMSSIIKSPPVNESLIPSSDRNSLLPPFLHLNSRITYKHNDQYHKGYLQVNATVSSATFLSPKQTSVKRSGVWICLIFIQLGLTCALRVLLYQATHHIHFFALR